MELAEPIETINKLLKEHFGVDTVTGQVIWRVVWSEEQFENRLGIYDDYTPAGIYLRTVKEVRYVPKYRQWITEKYVLERLVVIPEINQQDLPDAKVSYEPIWVFEDKHGKYLPPKFLACKVIIDTVYAAQYGPKDHSLKKWTDEEWCQEASLEAKEKRLKEYEEILFGDQSSLQGTTVTGESIIVPQSYERSK